MLHKPFGYVLGVEGHPIKPNDPSPLLSQEDDSLGPASRHIPPSEKFSVGCTIGKITIGKLPDREAGGGVHIHYRNQQEYLEKQFPNIPE